MAPRPPEPIVDIFDDDEGWEDMPVVKEDIEASGLDEEDAKKYHYRTPVKASEAGNATGDLLDVDDYGTEWRSKKDQNESEYTRLRINEEEDVDEVHLRTRYLFDEDKAMTPLSQMQATKNLLTEAQRIAYVGVCALTTREMSEGLKAIKSKDIKPAANSMDLWALKILGRLYYHMELETAESLTEQKMIESLSMHGIQPHDLVPALMTTHTVINPEYDPAEARRQADIRTEELSRAPDHPEDEKEEVEEVNNLPMPEQSLSASPSFPPVSPISPSTPTFQTTARVLDEPALAPMPGVTTSLSAADQNVTLDIRWTVLCDLFLLLIADSVYDARSRVLLEQVAVKLGLGWLDVVKFEQRVTEALEIQEGVERMESQEVVDGRQKSSKKRRYMMLGLATLGGGLVIGLSAGLLAPVIGAGLGAAFTTIGIGGTTGFLAGAGGAAVITTGGVLTGSSIAVRGMANRTQQVRTFQLLPLHNNKRVNCILTVPGFMNSMQDDVRLPFSVLDPIVGDVFSVLWEPEMIRETGDALRILTTEVLTQIGQQVLQATVMTALMSALQWPIVLTKLGYLIDNPWSNALDRAKAAGSVLADVLVQRHLGVRPITLIGFSLGSRVIFYALLELAKQKAYGIVQDVFILGSTVTASTKTWIEARSVVSGRFVNGFCKNDWVLNYLFRATSGGLNSVAGLRAIENVPGLENVDVTDKISGHMSYRTFMPLILDQLGFPVFADHFDEPEQPDFTEDRIVVKEDGAPKKKGWLSRKSSAPVAPKAKVSRPPSFSSFQPYQRRTASMDTNGPDDDDDDLPPREEPAALSINLQDPAIPQSTTEDDTKQSTPTIPLRAGFDFGAIKDVLQTSETNVQRKAQGPVASPVASGHELPVYSPIQRSGSAPPPAFPSPATTPKPRPSLQLAIEDEVEPIAGPSSLTPSFGRSLSMSDRPELSSFGANPSIEDNNSSHSSESSLSFASYDGSMWLPSSNDVHKSTPLGGDYLSRSNFGPYKSTESISFGDSNGTLTSFGAVDVKMPPPPVPINPFASRATLSYGGLGDATKEPAGTNDDPWGVFSERTKRTIPSSNPWS